MIKTKKVDKKNRSRKITRWIVGASVYKYTLFKKKITVSPHPFLKLPFVCVATAWLTEQLHFLWFYKIIVLRIFLHCHDYRACQNIIGESLKTVRTEEIFM